MNKLCVGSHSSSRSRTALWTCQEIEVIEREKLHSLLDQVHPLALVPVAVSIARHSAIVVPSTSVLADNFVKVLAYYNNEWGYIKKGQGIPMDKFRGD